MKKTIAWLLVLAMTAALAVGGTLAYLTDTDEDVNVMTVGRVRIDQLEYERIEVDTENEDADVQKFHDNKPLYPAVIEDGFTYTPGDSYVDWEQIGKDGYTSDIWDPDMINNEQDKMVFVKNKGDFDAYVRTVFGFEANGYTLAEFQELFHLNLNDEDWTWEWTEAVDINGTNYILATATYNKILAPGAITEISLSQIALDPSATNADIEGFGDTYQILVQSQAVQAAGFDDPVTALNEAFGVIDINVDPPKIPFEDDNPTEGIDLNTAIHNLEGDPNSVITTQVKRIVYALNSEYPEIVNEEDGTLVDVEQDVPVYAYYVPVSGGYDIYLLADDVIYSPAYSRSLYNGMSALTEVDTHNYDVSRAETLRTMFQNCSSLTTLDATDWDTSKVTDITGMFNGCTALVSVEGTEDWDMSACTSMYAAFQNCKKLGSLNTTGWDTSAVTNMNSTFYGCNALTEIVGISQWDVGNVTQMNYTFQNCTSLVELEDLSNWDTSSVTTMQMTFAYDSKLKSLGTTNWDTGKVENLYGTFYNCLSLNDLDVSKWNTGSVNNLTYTFCGCETLEVLDVSGWDTSNMNQMNSTFRRCKVLLELDTTNWDTGKVTNTSCMFYDCYKLQRLETGNWNVSSVTDMSGMFNHCESLEYLDVANWNPEKCTNMGIMFQACYKLGNLETGNWNTANVKTANNVFYHCYGMTVLDLSGWDTSSATALDGFAYEMTNLREVRLGEKFSVDGNNISNTNKWFDLPTPSNEHIPGADGMWYDLATGTAYSPSAIPDETAAVYVAVNPNP